MRAALVIAAKDLRQRFRDRSAIVLGFVAPIAIAGLMSVAFSATEDFHATLAVVDLDKGPVAAGVLDALGSEGLRDVLTVRPSSSVADARRRVKDADADAGLVIPTGFSASVTGADAATLEVLTSTDATLAGEVVGSIAGAFAARIDAARLSVAAALAAGAPAPSAADLAARAANLDAPIEAVDRPTGAKPLKTISYYGPGMGIFFVLFAIGFAARSFFNERRDGTLDRMTAAPVTPSAIVLGKALSVFVYALTSLGTIAIVTTFAFGADWGNPLAVAAIIVSIALAVVALAAFVIVVSRTDRQADGIASMITFGLALLGGNFILLSMAPDLVRRLALLTPNGWALRAFTDLATGATGAGVVLVPVGAILGFTAVVALVTAFLAPRMVVR
jgi:ABC-2 type transport system permease protein